jgi:cobalt transporter subunit CbtA
VPLTGALAGGVSLRGVLLPALLAAIAAGIAATVVQQIFLEPLILQAESVEVGGGLQIAAEAGFQRVAFALLFNCLGAFGFGLLLAGCYALRGGVTGRQGLLWGVAGFASFSLAPALGLPPELPGMQAADLVARQMWWILTATTTAAGLACVVFSRSPLLKLLGVVVIAVPHVAGAPEVVEAHSALPTDMVRAFVLGSLAVSATMWLILGYATAALMQRSSAARVSG